MYPKTVLMLAVAGLLVACGNKALPTPVESVPAPVEANPPSAPPVPSPSSIPPAFVVSTNEPFWRASVEGDRVVLSGPGVERSLSIETQDAMPDRRRVRARDSQGTLEVGATDKPCQDDMSGAAFPYSGSLAFDEGIEVHGCARGVGDPQPTEPVN